MYNILGQPPMAKHLVTRFVSYFAVSLDHLKVAWENYTGINISNKIWEEGLKRIHTYSINARLQYSLKCFIG